MSVVVSIEDLGASRKQLQIEVPAPAVEAETTRVTQEYRKRARIPGFRRGKVPVEVVRQRFGEEIRQEVVERLVPRYWRQAQAEKQLEPMLPPEVSDVEGDAEAGLTFSAVVEVRPDVVLGSLEGFELPPMPGDPDEEEVERALTDLRRSVAEWAPVERSAARGDRVDGKVLELPADGSTPAEGAEGETVTFEVGDERVWEELSLAVTGVAAGGTGEFERREPEAEAVRRFRVEVVAVAERDLPPLDDAFAKRVGDFETVEALRADIVERLRQAHRQHGRERREQALIDQLCERHPLELPPGVVRHETEAMLREYAEGLAMRGLDPERAGIDWQRLAGELEPRARRRVQARLLLDAVAEQLSIELAASEFETHLAHLARAQGKSTAALRKALDGTGRLEELRERLRRREAVRYLLGETDEEPGASSEEE